MFAEKYPSADSLVYENSTVVDYELVSTGRASWYYIYVEEYEKPLEIGTIVMREIDRDALRWMNAGDTIVVSHYEGKRSLNLYALSHGDTVILSPASASFDAFKNFEARGNFFKELVNAL